MVLLSLLCHILHLQNLEIDFCPKLKLRPDFLPTTPLKTLEIFGNPILSECCRTEINGPRFLTYPTFILIGEVCEEMVVHCKLESQFDWGSASRIHSVKVTSFTLSSSFLSFFLSFFFHKK